MVNELSVFEPMKFYCSSKGTLTITIIITIIANAVKFGSKRENDQGKT